MSEQKQKMYAPEEIPKYLHRKGVNVPLPERKERKKREPKAKVAGPPETKNELTNLIGSMLEEATLTVEGSAPMSSRPKVQPPPEVPTDAPPVVKTKRTRASKTETKAGPKPSAEPRKTKTLRGPRSVAKVETPKTRAPNPWQVHLQDYRAKNPTISYKQAMADARASYVKV